MVFHTLDCYIIFSVGPSWQIFTLSPVAYYYKQGFNPFLHYLPFATTWEYPCRKKTPKRRIAGSKGMCFLNLRAIFDLPIKKKYLFIFPPLEYDCVYFCIHFT